MALTILQRPEGNFLGDPISASVSSSYGTTDATVYQVAPHGLADGQIIYIDSNIENYNEFWEIDVTGTNTFKLRRNQGSEYAPYLQDSTITYRVSEDQHDWNCVHLPITYTLSTNLFPVNSLDVSRTIVSTISDNGALLMNLSGSLGADVRAFDYIKLDAPNQTNISGVYQILEWINASTAVINLSHSSYNLSGATVQRYYNNYKASIRVYGGINASHEWAAQKPYELLATVEFTPDSNNEILFSVSEILKSKIKTENNLTLGTLPNNIDFWTNFYIEIAEKYDDSDGYSLGTYTSTYVSDQLEFEGYAANSKLPFKTLYSGSLTEYVLNDSTSKFLTLLEEPVIFEGGYQDFSFIKNGSGDINILLQYYSNGVLGLQTNSTVSGDAGIYRIPITANCSYDRVDVTISEQVPPFAPIESFTGHVLYFGNEPTVTIGTPS